MGRWAIRHEVGVVIRIMVTNYRWFLVRIMVGIGVLSVVVKLSAAIAQIVSL